jgi:hypothetical protein
MTYFAEYDSTVPAPSPVLGWYSVYHAEGNPEGFEYPNLPANDRLFTLTVSQWNDHFNNPNDWAVDGNALVPHKKLPSVEVMLMVLKAKAAAYHKQSDAVIMRFYEEGVPVSDDWKTYRKQLRVIAETGVGDIPVSPNEPAFCNSSET